MKLAVLPPEGSAFVYASRRSTFCALLAWAAAALATTGVAVATEMAAKETSAEEVVLQIEAAWIRAMPPAQRMTAAYMELRNRSQRTLIINGVSAQEGDASLHETRVTDGRSTMQAVETLNVDPEGTVTLKPGGLHIMLMGLDRMPAPGESLRLCLQGTHGETCVDAGVRRAPPETMDTTHHEHK